MGNMNFFDAVWAGILYAGFIAGVVISLSLVFLILAFIFSFVAGTKK